MANKIEGAIEFRNNSMAAIESADRGIKQLTKTLGMLQNVFTIGATADILGAAVKKYADLGESLGKLSVATGLSYRQLQALQQALKESGTAPEALNTATRILNVNLAQGDKTLAKYGITARDTYGAILQVGQRLAETSDSTRKAELATAAFGRSSQDLIDTISRFATDENFRKGLESVGFTDDGVKRLQKVDEALDSLNRSWERLSNTFAGMAAGPVAKGIDLVTRVLELASIGAFTTPMVAKGMFQQVVGKLGGNSQWAAMASAYMGSSGGGSGGGGSPAFVPSVDPAAGPTTPASRPAWSGVNYPQYGYGPQLREVGAGFAPGGFGTFANRAAGYMRMMGQSGDSGVTKELSRTQQAVRAGAEAIGGEFQGMMNRMLSIQTRSGNVLVQLSASIWNAVIGSLTQAAGQGISGFLIDFVSGFIPGMPKRGGGKSTASGAGVELHVHTLESKTLTSAMLNGSFRDAGINIARRQAVA